MRDVCYFVASSLDGFIATLDGGIDWLFTDDDYGFAEFYRSVDCVVMGRKTFDVSMSFDEYPYARKKAIVFSRRPLESPLPDVTFVSEDPARFVHRLKREPGGRIWVVGGGAIASALLAAGLIDEMVITVHPITLGQGIPLFERHAARQGWQLQSTRQWHSGLLQVTYRRGQVT